MEPKLVDGEPVSTRNSGSGSPRQPPAGGLSQARREVRRRRLPHAATLPLCRERERRWIEPGVKAAQVDGINAVARGGRDVTCENDL